MLSNNTSEKRDDLNMKSKINKQNIFLIILLIILIFIILGMSYAFLQTSFFASKDSVLKVGSLSLVLDESEGNAITVSADGPLSDNEGVNLDNYYSFKITNNGKVSSSYTIYLDDQPLDEGDVRIDQKYVHYSLERNDSNNVAKSLTGNQKLESGIINSGQTINYKLRLWFSNDMTAEEENKVFKAKLRIEASQNINTMASSLKLSSKEKQTITKIVFQDKINDIENTTKNYDLSANDNNSVIGKVVSNSDSTNTLYIQSNGEIFANSNSSYLFNYFTELKTIENLNLLNTSQVTDMSQMFSNCRKLTSLDLSNFDTSNVTDMFGMFSMWDSTIDTASTGSLTSLDLSNFDTSNVTDMRNMFAFNTSLNTVNIDSFDTSNVTNMYHMFIYCTSLKNIELNSFDTSNVTNMAAMFYNCKSLIMLNLNSFNTLKVTDMGSMFENCKKLSNLNLDNFNTSNVVSMSSMFSNCKSLISLNLSSFNTSNVTNMTGMFTMWNDDDNLSSTGSLEKLDLSNFDTSKVVSMSSMFAFNTNLVELDIGSFNTINTTNMYHMFNRCDSLLKLNLKSATFDNVSNYEAMFYNIPSGVNIVTKDTTTKSWLEDRLNGKGTVTIR